MLSNNPLENKGVAVLASLLAQLPHLKRLELARVRLLAVSDNAIRLRGATALVGSLARGGGGLRELPLENCQIGEQRNGWDQPQISPEHQALQASFAQALAGLSRLARLVLQENGLGEAFGQ